MAVDPGWWGRHDKIWLSVQDTLTPGVQTISPEQLRCASHCQNICPVRIWGQTQRLFGGYVAQKRMELFEVIWIQKVKRKKVMVYFGGI